MEIKWTEQALEGFNHIQSQHFPSIETKEYKKDLVIESEIRLPFLEQLSQQINQSGKSVTKLLSISILYTTLFRLIGRFALLSTLNIPDKKDKLDKIYRQ